MNLDWNCHLVIYSYLESVDGQLSWDIFILVMRFLCCHSVRQTQELVIWRVRSCVFTLEVTFGYGMDCI
jgi:hypothetical protein